MNIYKKLLNIQRDLVAPKNQTNTFGGYKYRSCEDILEAVKPLLSRENCTLVISDTIEHSDTEDAIRSVATLYDCDAEDGKSISASASAGIEVNKKGMDASQKYGCASSYARKYALNGLFCIDDNKDPDSLAPDTPKKGTKLAVPVEPKNYVCADCGKAFEPFTDKNGKHGMQDRCSIWPKVTIRTESHVVKIAA